MVPGFGMHIFHIISQNMYLDNDFVEYVRMKKYPVNPDELKTIEITKVEDEISAKFNAG